MSAPVPWGEKRWLLSLLDYSYVLVLSDRGEYLTLITTFCVEKQHRREKLKEQHLVAKAVTTTRSSSSAPPSRSPGRVSSTGALPTVKEDDEK